MRELRDRNGCDVLLASMFGDSIVAVHHERGTDPTTISYSRGRQMPLFRGAGSKVILAALSGSRQRRIVEEHRGLLATSTVGRSWEEVRAALKAVRRAGHALSLGELDDVNVGIAVPLVLETALAPASLVLVLNAARYRTTDGGTVVRIAQAARDRIVSAIALADEAPMSIARAAAPGAGDGPPPTPG